MPLSAGRLMLVTFSLGPGGAERVMSTMANYWVERGLTVSLVTLAGLEDDFYRTDQRVRRISLRVAADSRNPLQAVPRNLRRIRTLRRTITNERPEIIVSFLPAPNVLALLATVGTGIPVVVSERVDPAAPLPSLWNRIRRAAYRRAAALVVQTENLRPWAEELTDPGKVHVIPNAVSLQRRTGDHETDPGLGRSVVAMGRLVPAKGFDLLIRGFARAEDSNKGWTLTIWGEGPQRSTLEQIVRDLGLSGQVKLPGLTADPAAALRAADLFVLSSRVEGFPNVLLEAMACGLPVVAFDCPSGPRDIIRDGTDGVLVPAEDVEALAGAMRRLMSDPSERSRLSARAVDVTQRFDIERVMDLWGDLLTEVMDPAGPPR